LINCETSQKLANVATEDRNICTMIMRLKIVTAALSSLPFISVTTALPNSAMVDGTGLLNFHNEQIFKGPTMWIFSPTGVQIFDPSGETNHNIIPSSQFCDDSPECVIHDVVSDHKRHVYVSASSSMMKRAKFYVFDLDTGGVVGSFDNDETCLNPKVLSYHALQNELWSTCTPFSDGSDFETNVWSASYPQTESAVPLLQSGGRRLLTDSGSLIVDTQLGTVGYGTPFTFAEKPTLLKIDLTTKTLKSELILETANSAVHSIGEMSYSKKNQHLFVRTNVCCTCNLIVCNGNEEIIPVGPSAGELGVCDSSCNGIPNVDIGGVLEIDTSSDSIITQHLMSDGETTGDPYVSPDGRWVAMITKAGAGRDVRILKTGSNGEDSKVAFDISIPYDKIDDLVFIQSEPNNLIDGIHRDYLLFTIQSVYKILLLDLTHIVQTTNQPQMYFIEPKRELDPMKRSMEWVEGTPYVWVRGLDEAYVLNVDEKKVTRTLPGINVSAMLIVRNQEREMATMIAMEQMALAMANVNAASTSNDITVTTEDDDFDDDYDDSYDDDDAYEEKEAFDDDDWFDDDDDDAYEEKEAFDVDGRFDDDDGDVDVKFINDNNDNSYASTNDNAKGNHSINIDPISISALIIGIIAITIGIANLLYFNNLKKKFQTSTMNSSPVPLNGPVRLEAALAYLEGKQIA